MPWKFIPAKQDIEDDFCATFLLGRTTIGSWRNMPTKRSYKSGTNSHALQPLEHPQLFQKKDHGRHKIKVLFLALLLGLVCAAQEEEAEQSLSEVPGMVWFGRSFVCVCVCVCAFCDFVMWIHKLNRLPPTQLFSISWLYTSSIWSLQLLCCCC